LKVKRTEIVNKLKSTTRINIKLEIQKMNNNYILVLNTPFPLEITNIGNFSKIFGFEQTIRKCNKILSNIDYLSENISELLRPLSVIEGLCNIAEYSYANNDDHPHIHERGVTSHKFNRQRFIRKSRVQGESQKDTVYSVEENIAKG
jgi:hypothetical protein